MGIATLLAWLLTAGIGGYMLRTWVARGGLRHQRATGVGVPPLLLFGHAGAALAGLALWACYLPTRWVALAWLDVGLIGTAITLGICMVTLWTPYPVREPRAEHEPAQATATVAGDPKRGEQAFRVTDDMIASLLSDPFPPRRQPKIHLLPLIPACHGFAALVTFMLATVTAASGR